MPPTYFVLGLSALKSRRIRSGALAAAGSGTVVRCRRRNRTPSIPDVRMILAARLWLTASPFVSRSSAVIYGAP
jgi:hypothetical protein